MLRPLRLHPDSACTAVTHIETEAARTHAGDLALRYVVTGRLDDLLLPPPAASARTDELWRTTCFEAFLRTADESYLEFNFAPSTQWAVYRFDSYRNGMRIAEDIAAPRIEVLRRPHCYELIVSLSPALSIDATWRLGLSAIIEETNGCKSYWALAHPPGKADFHHSDCFALEVSAV